MSNKDKVTVKIINKATQEIITEFSGDEYEVLIEQDKITEVNMNLKSCDNCGYSFIKANDFVQCYNPYTDFSPDRHILHVISGIKIKDWLLKPS